MVLVAAHNIMEFETKCKYYFARLILIVHKFVLAQSPILVLSIMLDSQLSELFSVGGLATYLLSLSY